MLEARTVSISIERPWRDLYEAVWRPGCFPKWASGLSGSSLEKEGEAWKAEGPEGPVRIRFTDHNSRTTTRSASWTIMFMRGAARKSTYP